MAVVNPSNLRALLLLAWRTLVHFLTLPFRRRRGLVAVRQAFAVGPVPPPAALACNGCGRCVAVLAEAPSLLLRLGREHADGAYAGDAVARLAPHASAISGVCPYGVDVPALLAYVSSDVEHP